jgi:hypothetical protein
MRSWSGCVAAGLLATVTLSGCASRQETAVRLGQQYVGQNVDDLVVRFGPPKSSFKMNSGDTSYIWEIGNQTNLGESTRTTLFCRVSVIVSPNGIVRDLQTEDANYIVGPTAAIWDVSICAQRLGNLGFGSSERR